MLQRKDKVYLLVLIGLLMLFIFALMLLNSRGKSCEKYKSKNKDIFILYTGGAQIDEKKLKALKNVGQYDVYGYTPPLKSANVTPDQWIRIAGDIMKVYNQYDAFIVVHGSDTMAYTASALSFMFENLDKTIIVTDSDVYDAMKIASNYTIPEVLLCVNNKIIRGCRGSKTSVRGVVSPKFPILGTCVHDPVLKKHLMLDLPTQPLKLSSVNPTKRIVVVKMFPGIDGAYILGIAKSGNLFGVILETYGMGKSPIDDHFLTALKVLIEKGVVMVDVSQDMENNGNILHRVGVISGMDMTTEAALAKLYLIISNLPKYDRELIQKLMHMNMRGEIGSPTPVVG